jgi:O6-methylguanine-DNA--protein-cysteine methyltransferase
MKAQRAPHQNSTTTSTPHNSIHISSIEAALAAIETLKPGETVNYQQIAKKYGVVRSTLTRRHQGLSTSRSLEAQNRQALHPQ